MQRLFISPVHFVAKICAEYWLKSVPNIARYFTKNIPVRQEILPTHPHFVSAGSPPRCINHVHQCVIGYDIITKFRGTSAHHWHQYQNLNYILGLVSDFLINVCSSGTNISMSENIWILRMWENLDKKTKRTYLFHVLSQSKFGPLISSLQDFTSIQISRYIKITMLVPLQKYQFCRRGCRKHSLVHSWQGLVG